MKNHDYLPPYSPTNNARAIIRGAIAKANKMHNPAFNMHTEELTGEPSDRTAYDYAGCELETNQHDNGDL